MTLGRDSGLRYGNVSPNTVKAAWDTRSFPTALRLSTLTASPWAGIIVSPSQLRLDSRVGAPSRLFARPRSLTLARGVLGSASSGGYAVLKGRYLPLRPARTVLASVVGPIAGGMFT